MLTKKMKKDEFLELFEQEKIAKVSSLRCRFCLGNTKLLKNKDNLVKCTKNSCRKVNIILNNKLFKKSHIEQKKILAIIYILLLWSKKSDIANLLSVSNKVIRKTLKIIAVLIKKNTNNLVGGDKVIVKIDESKFGNRKYNRGHKVNGTWIIGGVERTTEKKIFLYPIAKRSKDNINKIIKKFVKEKSIIYTDCWKGYVDVKKTYEHFTVNHSIGFKNEENGVLTNTIEGNWYAVKSFIKKNNFSGTYLKYYLNIFVFLKMKDMKLTLI